MTPVVLWILFVVLPGLAWMFRYPLMLAFVLLLGNTTTFPFNCATCTCAGTENCCTCTGIPDTIHLTMSSFTSVCATCDLHNHTSGIPLTNVGGTCRWCGTLSLTTGCDQSTITCTDTTVAFCLACNGGTWQLNVGFTNTCTAFNATTCATVSACRGSGNSPSTTACSPLNLVFTGVFGLCLNGAGGTSGTFTATVTT